MRLFNAEIIERHLEGAGAGARTSLAWACLLARAEALKFSCIVDQVTGSPTLTLFLQGSLADGTLEQTKTIFSQSVTGSTMIPGTYSSADATFPPLKHLLVTAALDAGGGTAHVRVWACGRGPQLLEASPPTPGTFAAQLAAARMIEDEDRLPGKKRALRQGASLFYPPELWEPSLKWDR